ncbi:MAG TPA: Ig-like domain repeat protein, partial [Chthoniobacterales bacterium]
IPGGAVADLGVRKSGDSQALADTDVTYTITVENFGPDQAMNAQLSDTLPGDMAFVSFTQTAGPIWTCSMPAPGSAGTISCNNTSLATGKSTFVLVAHIPAREPSGTIYDNFVSVSSPSDPNGENDSGLASTTVVAAAPTLTTQASPSVQLGGAISDTATLSGGLSPTGTITFFVFGPDDSNCGAAPAFTSAVNVNGNGQYGSGSFVPTAPGTYRFVASYTGDENNKAIATVCNDPNETVTVTAPPPTPTPTPSQALNLSTRVRVETGSRLMIGGFIITGNQQKSVVLRGMGPSLAKFGITDLLLDPVLQLRGSSGNLIFENDNWKDTQRTQIEGTPFQPTDDRESVIVTTLAPGAYTALLTGKNGTTGIGAVEIYDNNQSVDSELANMSTRGFVQTQDKVMIGGFTLGVGNGPTRIAIRGLGPSLSQSGLSDVLADPVLELRNPNGTLLVANDDWQSDPTSAAQLSAKGLALPNPKESGIFTVLSGGQFTAILAGKDGGIGLGLVEIYNLK